MLSCPCYYIFRCFSEEKNDSVIVARFGLF